MIKACRARKERDSTVELREDDKRVLEKDGKAGMPVLVFCFFFFKTLKSPTCAVAI